MFSVGHAQASQVPMPEATISVDLLSDAATATTDTYMRTLIADLRTHWIALSTHEDLRPSAPKPGETVIDLTIAPDGHLAAMKIEGTAHQNDLDKAAWAAARDTQYLPPPTGMRDRNLKLRVHFILS